MPEPINCRTCRYWSEWPKQPDATQTFGDCRHGAPCIVVVKDKAVTKWPSTRDDAFCGQHKPEEHA